ncbi:putative reverse transcriptase domain-containing protein [Tanacetum coccineum]
MLKFVGTLNEELNSLGIEKTSSRPSTSIFSPPPRLLQSRVNRLDVGVRSRLEVLIFIPLHRRIPILICLRIMPPRRLKKKYVKRLVEKRVAKAIEEYKKTRANLDNARSSGGNSENAGRTMNMQGCSHKTFMNGKPHPFNGTEGVVGLRRWIEKVEQVFEIWLVNANRISWTKFKTMMTTEYCLATEIQRMEQELWTLTLKGDDIEAYNNCFHELALMCPELVPNEKKNIKRYIRGFPEGIKENITSLRPKTLHDAINMARELVEQAVQGRAARITPAKGRCYIGNLPWCNRRKAHHHPGPCSPRCSNYHNLGHEEEDCRTRIPVARGNSL